MIFKVTSFIQCSTLAELATIPTTAHTSKVWCAESYRFYSRENGQWVEDGDFLAMRADRITETPGRSFGGGGGMTQPQIMARNLGC